MNKISDLRIIFMGTPQFALPALKTLHEAGCNIISVYTQPPKPAGRGQKETSSPVHQYAVQHALPVATPLSLKTQAEQDKFKLLKADLAVVVAYGLLLPAEIISGARLGCINIHPSALPRWRGAAPIQRCIMAGDSTTEICIMQMDEGLDTGAVILRKKYQIKNGTTAGELHDFLAKEAPDLLVEAIKQLADGTAQYSKQDDNLATYAPKINKAEARLDFNQPAEQVLCKILALSPSPGAWFEYKGERIKIYNANINSSSNSEANSAPLAFNCNPGIIYPTELQREGKKRMKVEEFIAGFKFDAAL